MRRVLRIKHFLGSTIEDIDNQVGRFLSHENICIGNYKEYQLHSNGSVYQAVLVYAEVVNTNSNWVDQISSQMSERVIKK